MSAIKSLLSNLPKSGSKKVTEAGSTDETALTASAESRSASAQAPEASAEGQSRDKEARENASAKDEGGTTSKKEAKDSAPVKREGGTTSKKIEEALPPAPVSQEDENKISKLRQISQMWRFLPIPEGPEASVERRADAVQCGNACVMGASVRGKKHAHGGTDCDDWFEIRTEEKTGAIFIAVSDGAGSKKYSRIGAKASCKAAVESLRESFLRLSEEQPGRLRELRLSAGRESDSDAQSLWRGIMSTAMLKAREALYFAFEKRISDPAYESLQSFRDLSATLLLAVVLPSQSGEHTVSVCQVGDGAMALFRSDAPYEEAMSLLGTPDSGDYAGETEFMTSPSLTEEAFEKRVTTRSLRFDAMFVMTDGVADDYFPANPELFRLYFDLTANGVLPPKRTPPPAEPIPVPAPLDFSGAAEEKDSAPLNYVWLIRSATKRSLKDLWEDASPLERASRFLPAREGAKKSGERLEYWLEHYVEAASFDDRTLVVVRLEEGGESDGAKEENHEKREADGDSV